MQHADAHHAAQLQRHQRGDPHAGLIADAAGDLFGTTASGGANDDGTVFEIANTRHRLRHTPTTLVSFNGTNGANPVGRSDRRRRRGPLRHDRPAAGRTATARCSRSPTPAPAANTPTTLVSFNGTQRGNPYAGLIADAAGDLFGTTAGGGANGDGTVFEIANNGGGSQHADHAGQLQRHQRGESRMPV